MKKEIVNGLCVVVKENPWDNIGTFYSYRDSKFLCSLGIDSYIYSDEIKPDGVFIEQVYKVGDSLIWKGKTMWRVVCDTPKRVKIQQQHLDGDIEVYFTAEEAQAVIDNRAKARGEKYIQQNIYTICEHAWLTLDLDVSDMKPAEVQKCVDKARDNLRKVLDSLKS